MSNRGVFVLKILLGSLVLLITVNAHAFFVPVLSCQSQSKNLNLKMKQEGSDITINLENRKPYLVDDMIEQKPGSKKYRISATMSNAFLIHDRGLGEFHHSGDALELVVALMYQRPEFVGEEDLVYGYARSLVSKLVCQ